MKPEDQFAFQQRRSFLKFIAKAGVALPILQASSIGTGLMLARQAEAAGSSLRKIIFLHIPEGTPNRAAATFTPDANLTLKTCSKPLETVKSDCVFFDQMDVEGGGGHGNMHRVLGAFQQTGFTAGSTTTIDLALADTIGATSPVSALLLGVRTGNKDTISARNTYTLNYSFQDNPKAAFDRLFGGAIDASPIGNKRDKKIQDANLIALTQLKTKLGSYELARLEEHEAAINKLKNDIDGAASAGAIAGCTSPLFNPQGLSTGLTDAEFHDIFALQTDNLLLAMHCNLTRVGVLQLGDTQAAFNIPGVPNVPSSIADLHGTVHSGTVSYFEEYRTALTQKVTYLINKLKTTDDGFGGKMIDSTLLVHITDMSNGMNHEGNDAPFFLAGGGAGVKKGQVISMGNATHHRLLDTAAQYMGVYGNIKPYDKAGPISGILI